MNKLTTAIKNFATQENCIIGICNTEPLPLHPEGITPFVSKDPIKRTDPTASLPCAKSILVVGVPSKIKDYPPMPEGAGIISMLGVTEDYHTTVKTLLKKLAQELQQHTKFMYKILVDSPTLDERALAVKAGLGFIGQSGLVISKKYGSRFNIGLLLTDIPISDVAFDLACNDSGQLSPNLCCPTNCHKCIKACPTKALSDASGPTRYNVANCISYLTQKDDLTQEEATKLGRHLYGCDICQDVCPHNPTQPTAWARPEDWLNMTDDEFAATYPDTPIMWRGTALLRRNAKAVIANR